ncbi:MAG: hypothetical protein CMP61_10020 [Flavobacteriales bacterium]|jgi:uncharacterized protein YaiE (UPF0345 family)|nr:hypothetical protein [Flavobacteriales bacterium]|tara:strand:+ start:18345 stop:18620 length:276 start_codon:yes stop_codon:yes gene_type:complete
MEIKKNDYFEGNVQSLGFVHDGKTEITAGLIKKGLYDFGKANPKETMKCTSGEMLINGVLCKSDTPAVVIEVGEQIILEAKLDSTYTCTYG